MCIRDSLNSVLTSGEDLRITRRPMLGVLLAAFDAAAAARLGVPVAEGVRLSGVVPGLGAAAAGLGQDDVIVSINDRPTPDVAALRGALQSRQVGDIVTVAFYRGGARHELPMVLSGRTIPHIPASAPELLARVAERYARDEAALDAALDGVSDLEASFRPGLEEWNVKQIVAHLIQGERYNQQWISELLGDLEASYDSDAANQEVRLNATIHAFPTLADMVAEWKRLNAETLALIESLPEEFVRRRRTYWRLARTLLDESYSHVDDHLSQVLAAVAAARRGS